MADHLLFVVAVIAVIFLPFVLLTVVRNGDPSCAIEYRLETDSSTDTDGDSRQ